MSFRPVDGLAGGRSVRWRPLDEEGLEHLTLSADAGSVRAESVVIGARGGRPYGLRYRIDCDPDFAVTAFAIETTDGRGLSLTRRDGRWHDGPRPLPGFDACIDIDLAGTPFTNTLPIRRVRWQTGEGRSLVMLYVPFDSFVPVIDRQIYTCLGHRLFRYEAADRSFSAELPLDDDGLVTDYPTLFQRL